MSVTLYQGDCLDIMRTLPDGSVDAVVTDPPYGLADKWTGGTWFTRNVYADDKVTWDVKPPQEAIDYILSLHRPCVIWGGNYFALPPSRCWLVWSKVNSMPTMGDCELAWTNYDRPVKAYKSLRNGWDRQHPTEKPTGLMTWVLLNYTRPGCTILDPFMGSGTTGVACVQTGRNFIGIEIEPRYFEIAQRRIAEAQRQPALMEVAQ